MGVRVDWLVLAIDGRGGAGKTSLAGSLAVHLNAKVISLDSFLLPKSKERNSAIAKNYDLDRFYLEVVDRVSRGVDIQFHPFDKAKGILSRQPIGVKAGKNLIIEGTYSMELNFRAVYKHKIFLDFQEEARLRRSLLAPSSAEWLDKWTIGEDVYFETQDPKSAADLVLDASRPFPSPAQIMSQLDMKI
jgi:uridine kinase